MSLTLIYKGKNVSFRMKMAKKHWLPLVLIFAVLIIGMMRYALLAYQDTRHVHQQLIVEKDNYSTEKQQLLSLKKHTEHKLSALTLKMGEIKGQLNRLDAFAAKIADNANIPNEEFNFQETNLVGGPITDTVTIPDIVTHTDELFLQMDSILNKLDGQERKMVVLESILLNTHIDEQVYISGRPIGQGWLSSYYGVRKDPFTGLPAMHKGVDFAGKEDSHVIATGAGVVTWAESRYGYGKLIEIDHGDGIVTRYGHNKDLLVKTGEVVSKGQIIGKMGSTGRSTGPHVHYEVLKRGQQIDPLPYVYRKAN